MSGYKRVSGLQPSAAVARLRQVAGDGSSWHEIEGWPVKVTIRLAKTADGRMGCTAVVFDAKGDELTARMLRSMPLGELVAEAAGQRTPGAAGEIARFMARESAGSIVRTRPGPGGYPPEHFERIAALYRQALQERPRAPMQWVREQMGYGTEPTLRRWVKTARDRGLLGESTPGKAGEQPTTDQKE